MKNYKIWLEDENRYNYPDKEGVVLSDWGTLYFRTILPIDYNSMITHAFQVYKGKYKICRNTGLIDKDKNEVWEGSIIDWGYWLNGDGERAVVSWHQALGRFGLDFYSKYGMEGYTGRNTHLVDYLNDPNCKVIGNVYENPELLS